MRIGLFAWGCLVASSLIMPSLLAAPPVMTGLPEGLKPRQRERIDLEYRLYDNVDFVVQARKLGTQIKLAEERLKSLEKLQQEYAAFTKFTRSGFTITMEDLRLSLLEAKLTLADLREEKSLLEKYHDEQRELLKLRK